MKKKVKLIASLLVLVLLCGSYFGVKTYVRKQEEKEEEEAAKEEEAIRLVSDDEVEDVRNLKFVADKKEVAFEKEGEEWKLQEDADFPVDQESLEEAVSILKDMEADRVLEDVEDLAEYGLDSPLNTISFSGEGEEEESVIRVGMENESTKQYYVSLGEEKSKVYVVAEASVSPFMKSLYEYAEAGEFPTVDSSLVKEVDLEKKEGSSYRVLKDVKDVSESWRIEDGENVDKTDSAKISTLTSTISGLEFWSFVNYKSTNDEEYGLEDPAAVLTVKYEVEKESSTSEAEVEEEDSDDSSDATEEVKEQEDSDVKVEGASSDLIDEEENSNSEAEEENASSGLADEEENSSLEAEEENASSGLTDEEENSSSDAEEEKEDSSSELIDGVEEQESSDSEVEEDDSEESEPVYEEKELVLYIGDKTEDGSYYVKIGGSQEVYTMDSENVDTIIGKEYEDYLDLSVYYLASSNLEKIDIEMNGETHCINVSRETSENEDGEEKTETTYQIDGEELDSTSFSTFFNKMTNMTAQERLMSDYSPENESKISIEVEDTEGNTTNLQYYEYDTNYYAVVVEEKVYLVNKMTIREFITAYNNIIGEEGDGDLEE